MVTMFGWLSRPAVSASRKKRARASASSDSLNSLASEFSESELAEARARFFREAETAGRLNHPNIVTIYDVGEERGLAYIAMEYLKGRHLSEYATAANLLPPRKVLE